MEVNALAPDERITEVLYVQGQTVKNGEPCKQVTVKVLAEGYLIDEFQTNRKGKFEYFFDANTYYEIVFEKEGYITKRIEIDTYTHKLKNEIHDFDFNIEMIEGSEQLKVGEIFFPRDSRKVDFVKL